MQSETIESNIPKDGIGILDDLIGRYYKKILEDVDENLKPGDLLKMIELRHKLAPSGADQEKFWQMLAKIRQESEERESKQNSNKSNSSVRPAKKPSREAK